MNEIGRTLHDWAAQNLQRPGIRAFGIRLPDKTCFSRGFAPGFDEKSVDESWHSVSDVVGALLLHKIAATRLRWVYAQGQIHFVIRPDGAALGLFLDRAAGPAEAEGIHRLLDAFAALPV